MAKISVKAGATSITVNVFIQDSSSTTGAGLTGLVFNSAGLVAYYALPQAAAVAITLATLAAVTSAWSSGGFKEIDATNMPGWYRFDLPNTAVSSGRVSSVHLKGATNMAPLPLEIELTGWDNQDAVHGGLSAIPNATAGAAGGLFIAGSNAATTIASLTCTGAFSINGTGNVAQTGDNYTRIGAPAGASVSADIAAVKSDTALIKTATNTGVAPGASGGLLISGANSGTTTFGALTITGTMTVSDGIAVSRSTNNQPAVSLTGQGSGNGLTIAAGATGKGLAITTTSGDGLSILPTAGHAIVATGNGTSKHGAIFTGGTAGTSDGIKAAAGTGGVDVRGNITGNITGTLDTVTTYTGNTPQTGDSYARIGAPAGASVSADVAAVKSDTGLIKTATNTGVAPGVAGGLFVSGANSGTTSVGTLTITTAMNIGGTSNVAQTGDSYARIGSAGISLSAIPDLAGVTTLLGRLTSTRAGNLDNLDAAVSSRSTYAGGDTSGTTTLLSRLSALRASSLDNLDAAITTRLATSGYTAPDNASITTIKTATNTGVAPGVAGGLPILGSNLGSMSLTGFTTSITGNLSGSVGSVTGAVGSVTGAVGSVTGAVGSVTGNVGGSVASVTAGVTVTTNNDKSGYSLTQAFPANFSALSITASTGLVDVNVKTGFSLSGAGVAAVQTGLATATALTTMQTDVTRIKKINNNAQKTDPATGIRTLYDDDGATPLYTAHVWNDAAGTIAYDGTAGINKTNGLA